jgi:hypothetical protein
MQPEMDFKVPGALDVPPLPSPARLAAEAFFAPTVTAVRQAPVATPVVWRKKAIAKPLLPDASADPEPIDGTRRTPRVFRVEPASAQPQAAPSPTSLPPPTTPRALAPVLNSPPVPPLRRRKPRQLHGNVTIIRPPQDEICRQIDAEQPLPAGAAIPAGDLGSATVVRQRGGPCLRSTGDARVRYPRLLARIRLLQAEAERARQREAAAAIRWIKRDIALYSLTAEDLGLR